MVGVGCTGSGWMHRVGIDAQGRGGCTWSALMHRVGIDEQGRGGCTG